VNWLQLQSAYWGHVLHVAEPKRQIASDRDLIVTTSPHATTLLSHYQLTATNWRPLTNWWIRRRLSQISHWSPCAFSLEFWNLAFDGHEWMFHSRRFYSWYNFIQYLINRNLNGSQRRSKHDGWNKTLAMYRTSYIRRTVTGYSYRVVSYKTSHAMRPFSDLLCVPIWVLIAPASCTGPQGETWPQMSVILMAKYLNHTPQGSLTCCEILWHGVDLFTFPLKEVVLRMFIVLQSPSSSVGFDPANLG
jgi:hypothetical protein